MIKTIEQMALEAGFNILASPQDDCDVNDVLLEEIGRVAALVAEEIAEQFEAHAAGLPFRGPPLIGKPVPARWVAISANTFRECAGAARMIFPKPGGDT